MNDCLVTKLKGTVNDDQLLKVGELRYKQSGTGSSVHQGYVLGLNVSLNLTDATYSTNLYDRI